MTTETAREEILELYKTKAGREEIVRKIIGADNLSIATIVALKESAMNEKLSQTRELLNGLALRAMMIFGAKKKDLERVKPLIAKDIVESGIIHGTEMEKTLIALSTPEGISR